MPRRSIELAYFDGCPHADRARENLAAALGRVGLAPEWIEWDLESPSTPDRVRGLGSPTVLVDGCDVTGAEPDARVSALACRAGGAPTTDQIVRGLLD